MDQIIMWTNLNQGFVEAILSIVTIIISIIALVTSINAYRLPYMKKLKISYGSAVGTIRSWQVEKGINITLTNIGNRNVTLVALCLKNGDKLIQNLRNTFNGKLLAPSEEISQCYTFNELKGTIDISKRVYGYAKDTEGTIYKIKIKGLTQILR